MIESLSRIHGGFFQLDPTAKGKKKSFNVTDGEVTTTTIITLFYCLISMVQLYNSYCCHLFAIFEFSVAAAREQDREQ